MGPSTSPENRLWAWLQDRLRLSLVVEAAATKSVPVHRYGVFYVFGGMALLFFLVQFVTGILLMLYYRPSAEGAFESVEFIMATVPFGWLVRSIHSWSAHLTIFFAFVHLASVFFLKAYRAPRELTWVTGCLLFFVMLGFGFSGYLLPWNQLSFFATKVGTDMAASVPLIGDWLMRFLRGGDRVSGGTLARFYGWHVAILPALIALLLGLHLLLVQIHGMSVPHSEEKPERRRPPMPFFPDFALRELFGWALAFGVLVALAVLFPGELGEKADPFTPAYREIRPEWYFVFLFETLKFVPGGEIAGIEYEAIPILGVAAAAGVLVLAPFIDEILQRRGWRHLFTGLGVVSLIYVIGMTAWGYRSLVPLGVVLATGLLVGLIGLVVHPRNKGQQR